MNDRRRHHGHDHDPDPAALDELRRAFGDDRAAAAGDSEHDDPGADDRAANDPAAAITTARLDTVAPTDDVDPPDVDPLDDVPPAGDATPVDHPAAVEESARADHPAAVDDVVTVDDAAAVDDANADATPDSVDDSGPAILSADLPGVDEPGEPFDLVIVEQEPVDSGEPTPPRVIRIDDYSGSTELPREPRPEPRPDPTPESSPTSSPGATPVTPPVGGVIGDPIVGARAAEEETGSGVDGSSTDDGGLGVISIADDELPDAVYVEGSLDRDGGGTIVIIEDDDTGDTLAPESERDLRRGIEPRMRERRVAVKRAQSRRRLKRLGIVVGVVLVVVAGLAVLGSSLFAVRADEVRVFNTVYTDEETLQEIIDDVVGTPVLRVDTTKIEDRIEEIPWVEAATVRTEFPHGLVVEIREREAVTTFQGPDQRFRVLDREGRVLDVLDLYPYAYVLIGGPDSVDLAPGEFAPQGYAAASELAKNLTPSVRGRVTVIEVNADGSRLVMHLDDGSTVFFGEARDLLAKLVRLEAVLANGQEREPGLIDVSTADVTR